MNEQLIIDVAVAPIDAGLAKLRAELETVEARRKSIKKRIRAFEAAKPKIVGQPARRPDSGSRPGLLLTRHPVNWLWKC